jgi:hypothetical protein
MLFVLVATGGSSKNFCYSYNFSSGLWGKSERVYGATTAVPVGTMGEVSAVTDHFSAAAQSPHAWYRSAADTITLQYPLPADSGTASIAPYVESTMFGRPDRKTSFSRLTPLLRSRSTHSGFGSTDVCSLSMSTYRERHDTTPVETLPVAESTTRARFDFTRSENFARFKVTFTDLIVEVEDVLAAQKDAGAE